MAALWKCELCGPEIAKPEDFGGTKAEGHRNIGFFQNESWTVLANCHSASRFSFGSAVRGRAGYSDYG